MEITLSVDGRDGAPIIRLFTDHISPRSYKEFTCAVSCRGRSFQSVIQASEIQDLLDQIRTASVSVIAHCGEGLDGVSYELSVEDGFAKAVYRWWMTPAAEWSPLMDIASNLLHLGEKISGLYLA